jgi:hypothetical protein
MIGIGAPTYDADNIAGVPPTWNSVDLGSSRTLGRVLPLLWGVGIVLALRP